MKSNKCRKLCLFNHKGGVGKTILTVQIACALADIGKKVLIVDTDPQCNISSYFLEDNIMDFLLDRSSLPNGKTVWSALLPIIGAKSPAKSVSPVKVNHPNLFLIPGDIKLTEFESVLQGNWYETELRRIHVFSAINGISTVVNKLIAKYKFDFVFYDAGPNVGPLNQCILLDSDYFLVPASCDPFSLRAIKTLGNTIAKWVLHWERIGRIAPKELVAMKGKPRFLGYLPQRVRVYGSRLTKSDSYYLSRLGKSVQSDIINELRVIDPSMAPRPSAKVLLGIIPDYGNLVPTAQREGVPIWDVKGLTSPEIQESCRKVFRGIANEVIKRTQKQGV